MNLGSCQSIWSSCPGPRTSPDKSQGFPKQHCAHSDEKPAGSQMGCWIEETAVDGYDRLILQYNSTLTARLQNCGFF